MALQINLVLGDSIGDKIKEIADRRGYSIKGLVRLGLSFITLLDDISQQEGHTLVECVKTEEPDQGEALREIIFPEADPGKKYDSEDARSVILSDGTQEVIDTMIANLDPDRENPGTS